RASCPACGAALRWASVSPEDPMPTRVARHLLKPGSRNMKQVWLATALDAVLAPWWKSAFAPGTAMLLIACLSLVPSPASAQATGAITGIATDASGGVLPGVTIEVTHRDTSQVRTAVTGADGFFTIPLLNPGAYQVRATLAGFRTTVRDNITVVVNETVRGDVVLQVGQVEQ